MTLRWNNKSFDRVNVTVICDTCGAELETGDHVPRGKESAMTRFWAYMNMNVSALGWTKVPVRDKKGRFVRDHKNIKVYTNYCPVCNGQGHSPKPQRQQPKQTPASSPEENMPYDVVSVQFVNLNAIKDFVSKKDAAGWEPCLWMPKPGDMGMNGVMILRQRNGKPPTETTQPKPQGELFE